MSYLLGEYKCRLDSKGRFVLPAGIKRQLSAKDRENFVVNRGFEKNLTLYPDSEWKQITNEINSLNLYNKKNREFARYFFRGATELTTDSSNRLLLPKSLIDYADIEKEIVLFAYGQRIEIWAKNVYEEMMGSEPDDFASLAEDVMDKSKTNKGHDTLS